LAVFLEDVRTDEYIEKFTFHSVLESYSTHFSEGEVLKSDESYWTLTSYWVEVVQRWLNGDDFVCDQIGVEHGNFVRAILKLSNIVEEWKNLATIMTDVDMLRKMEGIENKLVRGFVIPDSLYIRN
jgi:superfamily II RNA helicase